MDEIKNGDRVTEDGFTVIESPRGSYLHSLFAMALWIGSFHLLFFVIFIAIFVLPFYTAVLVYALLMVLVVIPIDADSNIALKVRSYIFENVCGYFPITVYVEDMKSFVPNRPYIFGFEPHSVLPIGVLALMHLTLRVPLPHSRVMASSAIFSTPILRHIWTWMGLTHVTKKNFTSLLEAGYACVVIPGGARETLHMVPDHEVVFLKTRKGFIRTAMEMGVPLIPVFSFGQSKVFGWWKPKGKVFLRLCRALKFTPMLFWGVWGSPLPYQVPLHVVVGRPIEVKKTTNPTTEEVDQLHSQFIEAIHNIFEKHKVSAGFHNLLLEII